MIKISQQEAEFMRSNKFGYLVHVSSATHKGRAKRYYLTEERKGLKLLAEYKEKEVAYSKV